MNVCTKPVLECSYIEMLNGLIEIVVISKEGAYEDDKCKEYRKVLW